MESRELNIENAQLRFRNFSGKEGLYNAAGNRNFCVLLDEDVAKKLHNDGWNIKWLKAREPEDPDQAFMQVKVSFERRPPKIVMMTSAGKTTLDERNINILDFADIKTVDVVINPSHWAMASGKKGIKGYLKSLYVTLAEDEFEKKYRDVPDSAISASAPPWNE